MHLKENERKEKPIDTTTAINFKPKLPEKKFLLPQAAIILRPQNICPFLSTHVSKNAFNEILFMNLFIFVLNWLRGATNVCFKWYYCEDSINVILCVYILYWQFYFQRYYLKQAPPRNSDSLSFMYKYLFYCSLTFMHFTKC